MGNVNNLYKTMCYDHVENTGEGRTPDWASKQSHFTDPIIRQIKSP